MLLSLLNSQGIKNNNNTKNTPLCYIPGVQQQLLDQGSRSSLRAHKNRLFESHAEGDVAGPGWGPGGQAGW